MSERYAESPSATADVRSFLPRPGEPVEDYAARLRALHHDLTLVLDAVERGLAAADREVPQTLPAEPFVASPAPDPRGEPADDLRHSAPPPSPIAVRPRGGARVEVVTSPVRAPEAPLADEPVWPGEERRAAPAPVAAPWAAPTSPTWSHPPSWQATPTEVAFPAPPGERRQAVARRSGAQAALPPWVVTAAVAGWLAVVALVLALLLGA